MSDRIRATAYLGLGSNLQQPVSQVADALDELARLPDSTLVARSSLYRTPPLGPPGQPDYINAVACLSTTLEPERLLDELQALEQLHGRVRRGERWGPRTLDLDLLLYGERTIDTKRLQVPHPHMTERAFVLYPMSEIAPASLEIPGHGPLGALLESIGGEGIERIA
jgi:2-amino-4-hydroxy-6-hydroxymethyldihydropteridine diphosphokinase